MYRYEKPEQPQPPAQELPAPEPVPQGKPRLVNPAEEVGLDIAEAFAWLNAKAAENDKIDLAEAFRWLNAMIDAATSNRVW